MKTPSKRNSALDRAIELAGGVGALSKKLGISRQAVDRWKSVPAQRVVEVERITGVPRAELLPELFDAGAPPP